MKQSAFPGLLALIRPRELDTLLLRACLLAGEPCRRAYSEWVKAVESPEDYFRRDRCGQKRLLPLLWTSLKAADAVPEGEFGRLLRTAYGWEQLRWESFRGEATRVVDTITRAGLDFALLPGVALVPSVYGNGALRHCHDLDLWVGVREREEAECILSSDGLSVQRRALDIEDSSILRTPSGFQVSLHTQLSPLRLFEPPHDTLVGRKRTVAWEGGEINSLSDTDLLLYVCRFAACRLDRRMLQWVPDAVRLIRGASSIDWEYLREMGRKTHMSLPLAVLLTYLRDELGSPIPVIPQLSEDGSLTPQVEEALCNLVVAGQRLSVTEIVRSAPSARSRLAVARYLLFPSPSFLSRERGIAGFTAIVQEYASRLWKAVKRLWSADLFGRQRDH